MSQPLGSILSGQNVLQGMQVLVKPQTNWVVCNAVTATALSTIAGVANRIQVAPFVPCHSFDTNQATIEVTTGVASALARIVVYSAHATTGLPDALLGSSGDLDCATSSTTPTWTSTRNWVKGTLYWIGVHHSSTATMRGIPIASLPLVSIAASTGATMSVCYSRTGMTFGSGAPDPFGSGAHDTTIQPVIRWRVV